MSDEMRELMADLVAPLPGATIRRMFGGLGLFVDGRMFALFTGERLYLKADDGNRAAFDAEGLPPFSYARRDGRVTVIASYRRAPEGLLDDPDAFVDWARPAIAAARRADARPPAAGRAGRKRAGR
jgi:DNA transformation protein